MDDPQKVILSRKLAVELVDKMDLDSIKHEIVQDRQQRILVAWKNGKSLYFDFYRIGSFEEEQRKANTTKPVSKFR